MKHCLEYLKQLRIETTFSALNIQPSLSRSTSARGYFSSRRKFEEDKNIQEEVAFLVKREREVRKSLNVRLVMNMVTMHLSVLKERKSIRKIASLEKTKSVCMKMKIMILMNKH